MRCRHFGPCGGCQTQDIPYPRQLERKREVLQRLLTRALGDAAPRVEPMIGMPVGDDGMPWGFRHKAAFVFGKTAAIMGHFAAGSNDIVPVVECPVHSVRANRIAFALRDRLARARIPAGLLRHVIVRTTHDEREAVVMLVVWSNDRSLRAPIRAFLESEHGPTGFFVNVHDRPGPFMVGRETIRIEGRAHVRENHTGTSFLISPTAFFQTNPDAAAALVREVLAAVPPHASRVLDLYAGSGLFSIPLAARGATVTAIEENPQAVKDAADNARLNALPEPRLRLLQGRAEASLDRLRDRFDAVVLDPPRQGCAPAVLERVFERMRPPTAVYVSCNPESLAAELPGMAAAGYAVSRIQPVDMFPHTHHIESVVTLTFQPAPSGARAAVRDRHPRPAGDTARPGRRSSPRGR